MAEQQEESAPQPESALPPGSGGEAGIFEALAGLRRQLEDQAARETAASKAIDYLSAELNAAKRQQSAAYVRPLLLDLLRIVDRMDSELVQAGSSGLKEYRDEFLEALRRFEVTPLEDPAEDGFSPELHLALRTIPAGTEAANLRVAEVLRKGYRYRGAMLRPAEVAIYKFRPRSVSQP